MVGRLDVNVATRIAESYGYDVTEEVFKMLLHSHSIRSTCSYLLFTNGIYLPNSSSALTLLSQATMYIPPIFSMKLFRT